ncbi:hypothetical protein V6667_04930 [Neisseria leonii]|uniref:Lipoprotein n=1 Tax=Neisseria leonii TaxID=2995413 RepID=A0A9X4E1E3_9NEIS|nr:hypothetical protein [Neisseria sp. 51.81]MDD9326805.1 hypothetical protein [Neisseria sp. 51.81]
MRYTKRLLTTVLLGSILIISGCSAISKKIEQAFAIKSDYYTQTQSGGSIENRYKGLGKYAVESQVLSSGQSRFTTYKIWYPTKNQPR